MTLLIGMYYNNKKGALIASDSRLSKDKYFSVSRKIFDIENIVIAVSGYAWIGDEFLEELRLSITGDEDIKQLKKIILDSQVEVFNSYKEAMELDKDDDKEDGKLGGIFGFYSDKPEIFEIGEGFFEGIDNFCVGGSGDENSLGFIKRGYKPDISKEQAINLAVYAIFKTSEVNRDIDDKPQIAFIENEGYKILNYDKEGKFIFDKPEILHIKEKIKKIDKYYDKAFDILSGGDSKAKKGLTKLLDEYKLR
jgi:20S proteasome alpha/beta subunit